MNTANNKTDYFVEDLRGKEDAVADFRVTFSNQEKNTEYSLLFRLNEENLHELCLIGFEDSCFCDHSLAPTAELRIPPKVQGCSVTIINSLLPNAGVILGDRYRSDNYESDVLSNIGNIKNISIPDSVRVIKEYAFSNVEKLDSIFIPKSIVSIGDDVFSGCVNLSSIVVDPNNPVYDSRDNCNAIVKTKENKMIAGCRNTIIPKTVTSLDGAFAGMRWLKKIVIPDNIVEIGDGSFFACENLKTVILPDSVEIIGLNAFGGCVKLDKIKLPNSLKVIGVCAFSECDSLREIYIPKNVNYIASGNSSSFDYCRNIKSIIVDEDNHFFDSRDNCNAIIETSTNSLLLGCSNTTIPNSVTRIGSDAMSNCYCGSSLVIPDSVITIEDFAFHSCEELEEIIIPETVVEIGTYAFSGCSRLRRVYIKNAALLEKAVDKTQIKNIDIIKSDPYSYEKIRKTNRAVMQLNESDKLLNSYNHNKNGRNAPLSVEDLFDIKGESNPFRSDAFFETVIINLDKMEENTEENTIGKVVFESFQENIGALHARFPFVKYLNIFNYLNILNYSEQYGSIQFYADFVHGLNGVKKLANGKKNITDQTEEIDLGLDGFFENLLDLEREVLLPNCFRRFGSRLFEYCSDPHQPLSKTAYSAVRLVRGLKEERQYVISEELNKQLDEFADRFNKQQFYKLLNNFDTCYDESNNEVTNTFFILGWSWASNDRSFYEFLPHALRAVVGVDRSKGSIDEINYFLERLHALINHLTQNIILKIQNNKLRKIAENSSITQALIRNMSHNIRSHVSNNYTSEHAYDSLKDDHIRHNLNNYISSEKDDVVFPKDKNLQLPYFIQYLNNRMDYLSEMTFEVPTLLTTKRFYANIIKELDRERILLNHISGISGFRYRFSMLFNGKKMSEQNDLSVALPDALGSQAFYNIIENIIRNTAKHATKRSNAETVFTIELIENVDIPGYYCVEIDNGIDEVDIKSLVCKQNEILNDSVLGGDNRLRTYGLGLLEMKVAAAFLRQIELEQINSYEYHFENRDEYYNEHKNLILLKAINKNEALGYRFFLQKPKEILLVGDYPLDSSKKDMINREGIQFFSEEDFIKAMHEGHSFSHPFLLYSDKLTNETKKMLSDDNDCKTLLPIRKVMASQDEINEVVDNVNTRGSILSLLKDLAWKKHTQSMGIEADGIHIGENVSRKFSNCRQVVFANHSTKSGHESYWSDRNRKQLPELWVDNLSSYTQNKLPLFAQYSKGGDCATEELLTRYIDSITPQLQLEIFEAYHNKVVVLDERIQRFALENFEGSSIKEMGGPIPISALFKSTNVIIPETKLDPEQFDEATIKEIEKLICDECDETNKAFLLLHYGILERMYKTEQVITEKLETWATKAKRVVVTSGRGSHSLQLPDSVCFANLSSVLNAFTENRNKYLINCLINQSRRKNE
ncbi:MAG: leucine-rich repeat protein [Bacteroidales bacterium]|nr:leucine-rich repeat protein [Bacteroidales bacterium]